jgi:hypothetical protein
MSEQGDFGQGNWLDARTSTESRGPLVEALRAMGYEVQSDDLSDIAQSIKRIVDESVVGVAAEQVGEKFRASALPPTVAESSDLRTAFFSSAREEQPESTADGMREDRPTRGRARDRTAEVKAAEASAFEATFGRTYIRDVAAARAPYANLARQVRRMADVAPDVAHLAYFLKSALREVETPTTALSKIRQFSRLLRGISHHVVDVPPVMTVFVDPVFHKNSGRFKFRYGSDHWKLSYLAGGDYLVLVLDDEGGESRGPLEAQVTATDPKAFSQDLISVFGGRSDLAKVALESLRDTLAEDNVQAYRSERA